MLIDVQANHGWSYCNLYIHYERMRASGPGFHTEGGGGGGGGNWDFPPPRSSFPPPQEFENYYRKISTMMINTNYVNCS